MTQNTNKLADAARSSEQITLGDIQAFVGPKADHYFNKWSDMIERAGSVEKAVGKPSWNWAAFFLTYLWLFYRKMYVYAALVASCVVFLPWISDLVSIPAIGVVTLVLPIILGMQGNGLYLGFAVQQIEVASSGDASDEVVLARLEERGGTSWFAALIGGAATFAAYGGLLFLTISEIDPDLSLETQPDVLSHQVPVTPAEPDSTPQTTQEISQVSKLADFTGEWRSELGEVYQIVFQQDASGFVINGIPVPVSVTYISDDLDTVFFRLQVPGVGVQEWGLTKVWQDGGRQSFNLRLLITTEETHELGFVRDFEPEEARQLAALFLSQSRLSTEGVSPQVSSPPPSYIYMEDGYSGGMEIVQNALGDALISIDTVNTSKLHTCTIDLIGSFDARGDITATDPDIDCTLSISIRGDNAFVLPRGTQCSMYCGQSGFFMGGYRNE